MSGNRTILIPFDPSYVTCYMLILKFWRMKIRTLIFRQSFKCPQNVPIRYILHVIRSYHNGIIIGFIYLSTAYLKLSTDLSTGITLFIHKQAKAPWLERQAL